MNVEKAIRAFLAIEPPPEVKKEIRNIQSSLKKSCPFDVRWVNPDGIHLTLKFFGNVSQEDIATISAVVNENTACVSPLHLKVNKLGMFPSQKRPRILWIGLEGETPPLFVIRENLERRFVELGFARDDKPFRLHLTIGRVKSPRVSGDPEPFIAKGNEYAARSFIAQGISLFKSDLTPQGAVYTRLACFPFSMTACSRGQSDARES